jgi:hypothetical protein
LLVLENPQDLVYVLNSRFAAPVTVVSKSGEISQEGITGFWRYREVKFDKPQAQYHKRYRFTNSRFYDEDDIFFASPLLDADPQPLGIEAPLFWKHWIDANIPKEPIVSLGATGDRAYRSMRHELERLAPSDVAKWTSDDNE